MALWSPLKFIFLLLQVVALVHGKTQLIQLDENDWDRMLTGEWMVEFFAPWCPACKALQPTWEDFSSWSKDLDLSVAQVDLTKAPGLSGRFMVTALPTIIHVKEGEFRLYKGTRDRDAFMSFIEDKKWKQLDPIPSWKSPASIQMGIVSYFFKLSQVLRGVHSTLTDDYGLPSWGSYVIFSLVTILLGAILGLILVCCLDIFFPPKVAVAVDKKVEKSSSESEIPEDDLVDDENTSAPEDNTAVRKRKVPKAD